jgi:hypothetical protein
MSKFLTLNIRDLVHGTVIAFLTVFLASVLKVTETNQFPVISDIKAYALTGATAAISYLIKNIFQNQFGQLFVTDEKTSN